MKFFNFPLLLATAWVPTCTQDGAFAAMQVIHSTVTCEHKFLSNTKQISNTGTYTHLRIRMHKKINKI